MLGVAIERRDVGQVEGYLLQLVCLQTHVGPMRANLHAQPDLTAHEYRRARDHRPPLAFGKTVIGREFRGREQTCDLMLVLGQNIDCERAAFGDQCLARQLIGSPNPSRAI